MEAFTILKFRRGSAGSGTSFFAGNLTAKPRTAPSSSATTLKPPTSSDDDDTSDDGPYFDLEFTHPGDVEEAKIQGLEDESEESEDENGDQEEELKFELSRDQNVILSPSDDLFFKGHLVPIEPSSILLSSSNSKFPAALVKSATRFRVLLLKLKKSKSEKSDSNGPLKTQEKVENGKNNQTKIQGNKFFFVKFKVEEVPLVSLFTRDSSSKGNNNGGGVQKNEVEDTDSNEKKLTKETVQKYLKMVKPLYIRVSKRYGEKSKIASHLAVSGECGAAATPPCTAEEKGGEKPVEVLGGEALSNAKTQKQGNNLQTGLKVMLKHLGKNRSESSTATNPPASSSSSRRDDSLLQQQDAIRGAILHCKRSFNASRAREVESFVLSRSASDPSHEKSVKLSADTPSSTEEDKKKSSGS